jgi:hypothetical protein
MTTIACSLKHKSMACDSRITGDVIYHAEKVKRVGQSLYGVAGDWEVCVAFFEWLDTDRKEKPALPEGAFEAIELTKTGIYQYLRNCIRIPITDRFYACGSGSQGAMVAMSLGHDPKSAISTVLRFDETTGPPIKSYSLCQPPR